MCPALVIRLTPTCVSFPMRKNHDLADGSPARAKVQAPPGQPGKRFISLARTGRQKREAIRVNQNLDRKILNVLAGRLHGHRGGTINRMSRDPPACIYEFSRLSRKNLLIRTGLGEEQ